MKLKIINDDDGDDEGGSGNIKIIIIINNLNYVWYFVDLANSSPHLQTSLSSSLISFKNFAAVSLCPSLFFPIMTAKIITYELPLGPGVSRKGTFLEATITRNFYEIYNTVSKLYFEALLAFQAHHHETCQLWDVLLTVIRKHLRRRRIEMFQLMTRRRQSWSCCLATCL